MKSLGFGGGGQMVVMVLIVMLYVCGGGERGRADVLKEFVGPNN